MFRVPFPCNGIVYDTGVVQNGSQTALRRHRGRSGARRAGWWRIAETLTGRQNGSTRLTEAVWRRSQFCVSESP